MLYFFDVLNNKHFRKLFKVLKSESAFFIRHSTMKLFALNFILSLIVQVYSQTDSTQQVTLSCPARPEGNRGPTGVPGKRGSKGESGSRGKQCYKF